jgi:hypothetical protein
MGSRPCTPIWKFVGILLEHLAADIVADDARLVVFACALLRAHSTRSKFLIGSMRSELLRAGGVGAPTSCEVARIEGSRPLGAAARHTLKEPRSERGRLCNRRLGTDRARALRIAASLGRAAAQGDTIPQRLPAVGRARSCWLLTASDRVRLP